MRVFPFPLLSNLLCDVCVFCWMKVREFSSHRTTMREFWKWKMNNNPSFCRRSFVSVFTIFFVHTYICNIIPKPYLPSLKFPWTCSHSPLLLLVSDDASGKFTVHINLQQLSLIIRKHDGEKLFRDLKISSCLCFQIRLFAFFFMFLSFHPHNIVWRL